MAKPITIEILGDDKQFSRTLKGTGRKAEGFGKKLLKLGALAGVGLGAVGIAKFGKDLGELATSVELTDKKISTVFEGNENRVRKWADSVNETFGLTETGVASLAASTADLLKPLGFTADRAADLSTELIGLAPALSNWSNGQMDASQIAEILNKAVLGEREGLKQLGISINQAEVDERALAIARADGRTEIEKTDRALATQELIFAKSTDAQKAFEEGSGKLAGAQDLLRTRWAEFQEFLARKLIPFLITGAAAFTETVLPAVERFAGFLSREVGPILATVGENISAFFTTLRTGMTEDEGTGIERFALFLRDDLAPVARDVFGFLRDNGPKVASAIGDVLGVLVEIGAWVVGNKPVLIGLATAIGVGLVAAFTSWAVSAGAAAIATIAAAAPVLLIGAAIAALVAGIIWAYQNVDIFRDSVDAVGRFLRDRLLPAIQGVAGFITGTLIPAVVSVVSWLADNLGPIVRVIARLLGAVLVGAIRAAVGMVRSWIGITTAIIGVLRGPLSGAVRLVAAGLRTWIATIRRVANFIRGRVTFIRTQFSRLVGFLRGLGSRIYSAITSPFRRAFNWVRNQFNRLRRTLSRGISIPNPISGVTSTFRRLIGRQSGGPVARSQIVRTSERGSEQIFLPKGSTVIPAHRAEPINRPVTVNAVTNADPYEIAHQVAWLMRVQGR